MYHKKNYCTALQHTCMFVCVQTYKYNIHTCMLYVCILAEVEQMLPCCPLLNMAQIFLLWKFVLLSTKKP